MNVVAPFRLMAVGCVRLWGRWVGLFAQRESGTALALFRIACGLSILYSIGSVVAHGLAPVLWLAPSDGGFTYPTEPWQFHYLGGVNRTTVWSMIGVVLAAGILLIVGLGQRITALGALQSYMAVSALNGQAVGAYDWLLTNALWLLVLSRSTATLSLDCRLRTGKWLSDQPVPAWPRYLVIYQLVLTYWSTGMHKLSAAWMPSGGFSALYYILQEPTWQRWDLSGLAWVYPLTQVATAVTWTWEITAPLLLLALWYRRTRDQAGWLRAAFNRIDFRRLFVILGLCVHLGIWILMDVGPFSLVALSYYLCLYHPREWHSAWQRLAGWVTGRSIGVTS